MVNIAEILEAIAWPITSIIIVFSLKKPIFELLIQAKKFKYKDFEMEFDKELSSLNMRVKEKKKKIKKPEGFKNKYFNREFDRIPLRGKIIEAWLNLETAIMSSVTNFELAPKNKEVNFQEALKILNTHGILDKENLKIIKELRTLRNRIVHLIELNLTEDEAEKFIETMRDQVDIVLSNVWNKYGGCSN